MSTDDKRTNEQFDDGLQELMNAFVGYDEKDSDDITLDMVDGKTAEAEKIELPEIPYEEIRLPEIDRANIYEYDEYAEFDDPEDTDDLDREVEKTELEKPKKDKKDKKEKTDKKEKKKERSEKPKADTHKKAKKERSEKPKKASKSSKHEKPAKANKKKAESKEPENEQKPVSSSRLVIVLTVICAAIALLLASVNHFTESKIADNNEKAMLTSIREIFDESVQAESIAVAEDSELTSAYLVMKDGGVCGYAASVAPNGFGGPVNLMVGIDSTGTVVGVEVVSMSETPGLGSRVGNDDFLSRFKGTSGQVSVDVISGASISSKAVMAGVNSVTTDLLDLDTLAAERGFLVVPYTRDGASAPVTEETVSETVTEAPTTETPATEAPVTVAPVTEQAPPDVSKGDAPPKNIVENPNKVNEGIHAEYKEDTAEYETLTTEPETTDPEETAKA